MTCGNTDICWNCTPPSPASHISIQSQLIRSYLSEITCIPWYKSREVASHEKGMFGVLEFISSDRSSPRKSDAQKIDDQTKCTTARMDRKRTLTLYVQGVKYREYEGDKIEVLPTDVLEEIEQRHMMIQKVRDLLSEHKIVITEFGDVVSLVDESTGCCYYDRAEMNITVCTTKEVSIKEELAGKLCLRVCGGETICPNLDDCNYANYL